MAENVIQVTGCPRTPLTPSPNATHLCSVRWPPLVSQTVWLRRASGEDQGGRLWCHRLVCNSSPPSCLTEPLSGVRGAWPQAYPTPSCGCSRPGRQQARNKCGFHCSWEHPSDPTQNPVPSMERASPKETRSVCWKGESKAAQVTRLDTDSVAKTEHSAHAQETSSAIDQAQRARS